jgi:hypothetical protein
VSREVIEMDGMVREMRVEKRWVSVIYFRYQGPSYTDYKSGEERRREEVCSSITHGESIKTKKETKLKYPHTD